MAEPIAIIKKYYRPGSRAYEILMEHSQAVKELCMKIASHNPQLNINKTLLGQAAMLHDIGMIKTHAPDLGCHGDQPYICHGYLGREILENEGLPGVALFCERHTGVGISKVEIVERNLPVPHRDMLPVTVEEKILCYADKFFSKSGKDLSKPKKLKKIHRGLLKYGEDKPRRFDELIGMFGIFYVYLDTENKPL